jgi:hypothetical protein
MPACQPGEDWVRDLPVEAASNGVIIAGASVRTPRGAVRTARAGREEERESIPPMKL